MSLAEVRLPDVLTLVLGAGSSVDYGYPTGRDLIHGIVEQLGSDRTPAHQALEGCGHSQGEIQAFRDDLIDCDLESIDAFLHLRRREYGVIGKRAIAAQLLPLEHLSSLRRSGVPGRTKEVLWYEYFFNRMREYVVRAPERLRIITFNYDRSFEANLLKSLTAAYGLPEREAMESVSRLAIVHVHGLLQTLEQRPYRSPSPLTPDLVAACADSIRVLGDDAIPAYVERAMMWTHEATWLCFLGFGYDETNLAKLVRPGELLAPNAALVTGSSRGLTQARFDRLESRLRGDRGAGNVRLTPRGVGETCLQTLQHWDILERL